LSIPAIYWIILGGAVTTYLTRIGGHIVLSRFSRLHPRVEAALDAVPAAVLTALIAPEVAQGGPAELAAFAVATLVGLRFGLMPTFLAGGAVIVVLRQFGL
jgi:uncharacterized membrane protein